MFLTGMLFISGSFVSCESSEDTDKVNTLKVLPSEAIAFKASGNADVVLTVTTDVESWKVSNPDWVIATQEGNKLTVNVKDNTTGGSRAGVLKFSAGNAPAVSIAVTQDIPAEGDDNVLSVTPSTAISFLAAGNTAVVLTVATDAASWTHEVPEWVTATKSGDQLTLNATDNDTNGTRAGRLTVSAGTAKPVVINISQKSAGEEPEPDKIAVSMADKSSLVNVDLQIENTDPMSSAITVTLAKAAAAAANVEIFYDEAYLAEYNFINKATCELFPKSLLSIANDGAVTIAASQTVSGEVTVTFTVDSEELLYNVSYLVPLCVKAVSENVTIADEGNRVNYILKRKNKKEVKNVLYFEVNDVNPLNALEYKLADGSMFFDAVILFAANINYNDTEDVVYLNNNPNVQALLDETDIYLQPLREKGIKVYLGLLGNHDAAGLCQLSEWGAQQWSKEVALAVKEYKLDGVNLDDEYSGSPISGNKWFDSYSTMAGSRLCYELKQAMKTAVSWETEVSVFRYGGLGTVNAYNGHKPGEFVDFWVANYGGSTNPLDGMTMKNCSGASIELSRGGYMSEEKARSVKEAGYGWSMWFSLNPVINMDGSLSSLQNAARGMYDQELLKPTGIYKKIGEGVYDPKRYEL